MTSANAKTPADLNVRLEAMRARHYPTAPCDCGISDRCTEAKLLAAIEAVVAVHMPSHGACTGCREAAGEDDVVVWWPCPTIRALTDAIGDGE